VLDVRLNLAAAELELLDDVGDLLEAMGVVVRLDVGIRDDEERGALKQHDLGGAADLAELLELRLERFDVWDQRIDDRGPGQIESLVPDRRREESDLERMGHLGEFSLPFPKNLLPLIGIQEIHLVNQAEHLGLGGMLDYCLHAHAENIHVFLWIFVRNIQDVDED